MVVPRLTLDGVAQRWRALAERRCAHLLELHRSGRWTAYYGEARFRALLRDALRQSARWSEIAPPSPDQFVATRPPYSERQRTAA
jgi:uncharacterized repeat protein (TIGR03809 family)